MAVAQKPHHPSFKAIINKLFVVGLVSLVQLPVTSNLTKLDEMEITTP